MQLFAMLPQEPTPAWLLALLGLVGLAILVSMGALGRCPRYRRWRLLLVWITAGCGVVFVLLFLLPPIARVPDVVPKVVTQQRLQSIAKALHAYAEQQAGRLPPAAVYGKDGQPLLSWRVLVLPYLGEDDLYRQFRLDEPRDGPQNLLLLSKMPSVYAPPDIWGMQAAPSATFWQVFVGQGTAFEGQEGMRLFEDFPDGSSNTILVAEAGEPVPWTQPAELPYDPGQPLPTLGGIFNGSNTETKCFHAVMADGSVRRVGPEVSEATLRDAITRNDGRPLGKDW